MNVGLGASGIAVAGGAATGTRQVRLETTNGEFMGMVTGAFFTVTK